MKKNDIVDALAEKGYRKKEAKEVIRDIFAVIAAALVEGESVMIQGFGTFAVRTRKSHNMVNVNTGERMMSKPSKFINFSPTPNFLDSIKSGDVENLNIMPQENEE